MNWCVLILLLISPGFARGAEVSLIEKNLKGGKELPVPGAGGFDQIREFIRVEDEKIKDIKLLSLELEKANLVLKRREVEAKLARLDKKHQALPANGSAPPGRPSVRLSGIFMAGAKTEALMNIDGAYVYVREGEPVQEGLMVKTIKHDRVTLEARDGKQTVLTMDS